MFAASRRGMAEQKDVSGDTKGVESRQVESFLSDNCPPMGIYETLYAFRDSFGSFMGTEGTHPWSQGFPLTTVSYTHLTLPTICSV